MLRMIALAVVASLYVSSVSAAAKQRVWIEVKPGKMAAVANVLAREKNLERHHRFDRINAFVVSAPAGVIDRLRRNSRILSIEPDVKRYPMAQEVPYGIDMVRARDVWDLDRDGVIDPGAATGAGATVCIIDSGISAAHDDLAGLNLVDGTPTGWDTDTCGHGSHVAGTIAAVHNDIGVVGVSPGKVNVMIGKVFDGAECAWSYSSTLADIAFQCAEAGANVINMSLGGGRAQRMEEAAFDWIESVGTLSIASAGNSGTRAYNYPASYSSVVSVAAVDDTMSVARFSQKNDAVELAAPGVGVLSTVPYTEQADLEVAGTVYAANALENAAYGMVSGALAYGRLCKRSASWSGRVVLCERGDNSFAEKVAAVEAGGGAAVVIYNNEPGEFLGTLGEDSSSIPAITISQEDGTALLTSMGADATVTTMLNEYSYEYYNGTSMSAPHVSGAAAVLFSSDPGLTGSQVREALTATAIDLGRPGVDDAYGYGLIDLYAAWQYLGGGSSPAVAPAAVAPTATR